MAKKRHALLLGGTGAMGAHLTRFLSNAGWLVTVTSRSKRSSENYHVSYVQGNAHDRYFLENILSTQWDVIVDFMIWSTKSFSEVRDILLNSCKQYVYLSSYRVFADSPVITENSPRLLNVSTDQEYLATDEYALAKARQEDLLRCSKKSSWTIVRPAITYSYGRFQLCTLECDMWMPLTLAGHRVPLSREMLPKQTTMSWGGDVALMIFRLLGRTESLGEVYNVCTSKHQSWNSLISIYQNYLPLEIQEVSERVFEKATGSQYQSRYDRMYDRIMDNKKILDATGLSESDLMNVEDGIEKEIVAYLNNPSFKPINKRLVGRLDKLSGGFFNPRTFKKLPGASSTEYIKYLIGRAIG